MPTRILVVEDERIVAKDIQASLQNLGYTVTALAASAEDALRNVASSPPDLVLMDIRLSGEIDGVQAAARIRAEHHLPVIFLTAYADQQTIQRAKLTEPFGYLLKPFEERELQTTIEMALYKHHSEQALQESRQWLDTTLRSIGEAVIATDGAGLVRFLNPVAERLTGWGAEEAVGRGVGEVLPLVEGGSGGVIESPVSVALREDRVVGLASETWLLGRGGHSIPIADSAAPIRTSGGQVLGAVLVFQDITQSMRALRRLIAQYDVSRFLIEAANLDEIAVRLLQVMGETLDWKAAALWSVDARTNELQCLHFWHPPAEEVTELEATTLQTHLSSHGELSGLVWERGEPAWDRDLHQDTGSPRMRIAAKAGLEAAFAFPIRGESGILGVIECFYRAPYEQDDGLLPLVLSVGRHIGQFIERKQAEEKLQQRNHQLIEVQETERSRLALELHDEIGQILTGLKFMLNTAEQSSDGTVREQLKRAQEVLNDLIGRVRTMSLDLRPSALDHMGLIPALLQYFARFTEQTRVRVVFEPTDVEERTLSPQVQIVAYRVIQEALTNVARHASVQEVTVRLFFTQEVLSLQVEDHGKGFDPNVSFASLDTAGLIGMQERVALVNGQLRIHSAPGKGTVLTVELPGGSIER